MKRIFIVCVFLFFILSSAFADVIIMKDGKKYTGVIIEYHEGNYVVKINGKKYTIPDTKVEDVMWTSTEEQISAASLGETLHLKKEDKYYWLFVSAAGGYLMPLFSDYTDTIDSGMLLYGGSFGTQGSNWGFALEVLYGSMSGTVTYREPNAASADTTSLTSGSLIILMDLIYRYPIEKVSVVPYLMAGLGPILNFDSLDYYPMGWKDYWGMEYWADPDDIDAGPVSGVYVGPAIKAAGGLEIPVNESFLIDVKLGYLLITKNRYDDVFKFNEEYDFVNIEAAVKAGGLFFDVSAKLKF